MIVGITRVRNESVIIKSTLDRLRGYLDFVIVLDDASTDDTVHICESHPLVHKVYRNKTWESEPKKRHQLETTQRQELYDLVIERYEPDWVLYFDADEHIYFDKIDFSSNNSYFFRLFDVYITPKDVDKGFMERDWIGCEYRDIPMLFRANKDVKFYNRLPRNIGKQVMGGYVKHFGKGISVEHWEETCDYYVNHLYELDKSGNTISEKWKKRKGKAVHDKVGDFGKPLIKWDDRTDKTKTIRL